MLVLTARVSLLDLAGFQHDSHQRLSAGMHLIGLTSSRLF